MKNRKVHAIIFSVILIAFIVYYFCCMPTYVSHKVMSFSDEPFYNLCSCIFSTINKNEIIYNFFWYWVHKIPEWTMLTAIIINGANMIFGFINYKKKWWYYLILVITIIMSIMLWDCFQILIHEEDMV